MRTREHPGVITADVDEIIAAIENVDLGAPWHQVAPDLRLTLPRRRAMPPGTDQLPTREFPPGIPVGLGLDIGPAMLFVASTQLTDWGVSADEAFDQAVQNVRDRVASRRQFALVHELVADVPTIAFQSREGWASSLLLLPEELSRVLGERDGLILAPMRDLILRLPLGTEPDFARYLFEEFASADMNALDLPFFAFVDGRLRKVLDLPAQHRGPEPMH